MRWSTLVVLGVMVAVAMGVVQGCASLGNAGVAAVALGPVTSQVTFADGYGVSFPTALLGQAQGVSVEQTETEVLIRVKK